MTATAPLEIAIMDRNPHVREFLCRELAGLGHKASALPSATALLEALGGKHLPQVLVLDPEAAGARLAEVAQHLKRCAGRTVVVLHVYDGSEAGPEFEGALVVEKQPDMGALKSTLGILAAQLARLAPAEERS